ncbi:MAG: hypothetical protein PHR39_01600 [Actinomycetota bacterium]|nr:hypothetical protein [Actinomycetota bacterium]
MKILTVTGIKDVKNIKIIDAHVHLWAEKISGKFDYGIPLVNKRELIESCLKDFKNNNGCLAIDCTPYECGRNGKVLHDISQETGIDILSVSGFHRREYYPTDSKIWRLNKEEATVFFNSEIQQGLKETLNESFRIRASIIKIPFIGILEKNYHALTNAAIETALRNKIPILVHTEQGKNVEWFSDYLLKSGVQPQKVVFCHIDKRNDIKLHKQLAKQGFYLEYDTFLREKYNPDANTFKLIFSMVKEGYGNKIMIGSDIFENMMWKRVQAEKGYGSFFNELKNKLNLKLGSNEAVKNILGRNAAEFLKIED